MNKKPVRRVYVSFEFQKDNGRWKTFVAQAELYCDYEIKDKSLPAVVHNKRWQTEAQTRINQSELVVVLLGQDTHNATGVKDEISLAGNVGCPVIQVQPQGRSHRGVIGKNIKAITYK
jgi:hypothetical protein